MYWYTALLYFLCIWITDFRRLFVCKEWIFLFISLHISMHTILFLAYSWAPCLAAFLSTIIFVHIWMNTLYFLLLPSDYSIWFLLFLNAKLMSRLSSLFRLNACFPFPCFCSAHWLFSSFAERMLSFLKSCCLFFNAHGQFSSISKSTLYFFLNICSTMHFFSLLMHAV